MWDTRGPRLEALTRRRALAGGIAALVAGPSIIRSGLAQSAAINIGVIQPLTGANAQFGVNCRDGIELAADAINAAGGIKALGGAKVNPGCRRRNLESLRRSGHGQALDQ